MGKLLTSFFLDRKGQSGGVIIFIVAIVLFSLVYIALSVFFDELIININEFTIDFPMTQERADALALCFKYWFALPIIIFFALIVWLIKNALRERTGEVY